MNKLIRLAYFLKTLLVYKRIFNKIGVKTIVESPLKIENGNNIVIGNNVRIGYKAWLAASPLTGEPICRLEIQDGCVIGNFVHIYATKSILIKKNVLIADKVYLSDNQHGYENVSLPIIHQKIIQNNIVIIDEGSWLGENVCILGATIGKNCVVGANSVVTKNVPDYCVVVGSPAKIIKRYCFDHLEWRKTDAKGEFI